MVYIKPWIGHQDQMAQVGRHQWFVSRLIELSRDLPVMEIPMDHLNIYNKYDSLTLRDFVMHMKAVMESDLNYPIILDEDGDVMDGRHRIMKALYLGCETIKAVRFQENPTPCRIAD